MKTSIVSADMMTKVNRVRRYDEQNTCENPLDQRIRLHRIRGYNENSIVSADTMKKSIVSADTMKTIKRIHGCDEKFPAYLRIR